MKLRKWMSGGKIGRFLIFDSYLILGCFLWIGIPEALRGCVLSHQKTFTHNFPWADYGNAIDIRKSSPPKLGFVLVDSPDGSRIAFRRKISLFIMDSERTQSELSGWASWKILPAKKRSDCAEESEGKVSVGRVWRKKSGRRKDGRCILWWISRFKWRTQMKSKVSWPAFELTDSINIILLAVYTCPTRLNSNLQDLKLCPACWAKIDKTILICFIKVIIRLLIKSTPHFDNSDDLIQFFFTFWTF